MQLWCFGEMKHNPRNRPRNRFVAESNLSTKFDSLWTRQDWRTFRPLWGPTASN